MKIARKYLSVLVVLAVFCMAPTTTTKVLGYKNLLVSAAGAETDLVAATGYTVGIPTAASTALGPKRLIKQFGAGQETYANVTELLCYATASDNNNVDISIYGGHGSGPPEYLGNFFWTFGTAIRSSGVRWADSCVVTGTHIKTIAVADSGNDRVVKVAFDAIGYEYLYAIAHTTTTGAATNITVIMRPF